MRIVMNGIDLQFESARDAAALLVGLVDITRPPLPAVVSVKADVVTPRRQVTPRAALPAKSTAAAVAPASTDGDGNRTKSEARRLAILDLMKAGPVTYGELSRKLAPHHTAGMDETQRAKAIGNALAVLKSNGQIERAGQNWLRKQH